MKSKLFFTLGFCLLFLIPPAIAQLDELPKSDSSKFSGGAVVGAVTIDGKTFQQFALRADIPIGKFGFGVDIQLLFDENGQIRKEDWDQWQDYLDKIYYIRYGKKRDPFYIKLGGLDYSYIGYSNIVNGYSNMVQYPSRKRYGGEISFFIPAEKYDGKPLMGAEFLFNDVKEALVESPAQPGIVFGTRFFYRPLKHLEIGISLAGDLNEYNAFLDQDKDGVPDKIDLFPTNKNWATERDKFSTTDWNYLITDTHWGPTLTDRYNNLVALGMIPADTSRKEDLFNLQNETSRMYAASVDIGIPIIDKEMLKLDVYTHFTQLKGDSLYGWGAALPGVRLIVGTGSVNNFLTFKAEYRRSSKEFLFGYFNNTYELERAQFIGNKQVITKQQQLTAITEELNGIYASAELNFFNYVVCFAGYQDLKGTEDNHMRSLHGELRMGETLKKMISFADVKGYYIQNNVQDFKVWKTPSTIMGYQVGYNYKGAIIGIDYRWAFQDLDGSGKIKGSKEIMKTISFRTAVSF
ncbi:MAG: hypothetical protein AB9846_11475 [Tenuifilaceae bacterium]